MIEEDRRRRGQTEDRGGGRTVGFFEDFVERDRLLAIGWDCTRLRCEMSGYEAELLEIVDGSWLLFARLEFVQSMGKRDVLI